jgi:hypothetical protein
MSLGSLGEKLAYHVKAAAAAGGWIKGRTPRPIAGSPAPPVAASNTSRHRDLIVIGASTGGIAALRQLLPALPLGLPPIAVVQHIAPFFSKSVAERIDAISAITGAWVNGSPLVVIGGRAPDARWGAGALQELDHPPLVDSVTKAAVTVHDAHEVRSAVDEGFALAEARGLAALFIERSDTGLIVRESSRWRRDFSTGVQ